MRGPGKLRGLGSIGDPQALLAGDAIHHRGVLDEGASFLQKPLTPDRLTRTVREVLDSAPPG